MFCTRLAVRLVRVIFFAVIADRSFQALSQAAFTHFEARQTHPIGFTPDGRRLLALNSPDSRLSVFDISSASNSVPVLIAEVSVGLEPVSIRARTNEEAWVVNEVSDSVSIVDLRSGTVVASLPCPDEPADVVFAHGRAFVSCARNSVLRVFDTTNRVEVAAIPLKGLSPRVLTVDAAGARVFVAFQNSGNRTTVLPASKSPPPPAPVNPALPAPPQTSLIVSTEDPRVPYTVLDQDVAEVSAADLEVVSYHSDVGTSLLDLAFRPGANELWVAHTDARNLTRFEPALKGHFVDNRVTRLSLSDGNRRMLELNPGVDYSVLPNPIAREAALAQPASIVFSSDGRFAWVAAFGSDRVARLDPDTGVVDSRIDLRTSATEGSRRMRGPRGLAVHNGFRRLYVLNKLANTLSVLSTELMTVLTEVPVGSADPFPAIAKAGRGFLYDARLSGNGTASCASCHIDADRDGLAWDLGDPGGTMSTVMGVNFAAHDTVPLPRLMHPMKGPMVTQTLRGLGSTNLLHWRGDRSTLREFNATFRDLMGGELLADADMDAMKSYLETLRHHPNPNRPLDGSLPKMLNGGSASRGAALFNTHVNHCGVCHSGATGSDDNVDDLRNIGARQSIKTPTLQTTYQRAVLDTRTGAVNRSGFGLLHDGTGGSQALPTVHFYELDELGLADFADVGAYVLCFDTGTAPAVGWNRTVDAATASDLNFNAELTLVEDQARAGGICDLVVHGVVAGRVTQFWFDPAAKRYRADRVAEAARTRTELLSLLRDSGQLTFLGVLPGQGVRLGRDRNENGVADGDETAPALAVSLSRDGVELSWSGGEIGWVLESSPEPVGPWLPVLDLGSPGAAIHRIPIAAFSARAGCFRLRRVW